MSVEEVREKIRLAVAKGERLRREKEERLRLEAERIRQQQQDVEARKRNEAALWVANVLPAEIEQAVSVGCTRVSLGEDKYLADACEHIGLRVSAEHHAPNDVYNARVVYWVHWD